MLNQVYAETYLADVLIDPATPQARRRLRLIDANTPIRVALHDKNYHVQHPNVTPLLLERSRRSGFDAGYHLAWFIKKIEYSTEGLEGLCRLQHQIQTGTLRDWWVRHPTQVGVIVRGETTSRDLGLLDAQTQAALPGLIPFLLQDPGD